MQNYDSESLHDLAPDVAPNGHDACHVRATVCEPIHSHSHSQILKTLTAPSQDRALSSALTLRPYQANAVQNLRIALAGG